MPQFRLNPTIHNECPKCGDDTTMLVVPGDQVVTCAKCGTTMKIHLPQGPCGKILKLVTDVQSKVNELLSFRLQERDET
ncbi:MAG: hypothetical protein FJX76_05520 [Armatimonadetes bacterium]|nr:hypothetical protein [Armatimonadota bacterium]